MATQYTNPAGSSIADLNATYSQTDTALPSWYQAYLSNLSGAAAEQLGTNLSQLGNVLDGQQLGAQNLWQHAAQMGAGQQQAILQAMQAAGYDTSGLALDPQTGELTGNLGAANPSDWGLGAAGQTLSGAVSQGIANNPAAWGSQNQALSNVLDASKGVGAQTQSWNNPGTMQSYMSPYTQNVIQGLVNEANIRWNNEIMPGINASMIGSGQFGSTRNADVLGRGAAQFQSQLAGQIANANQAAYQTAGQLFSSDADRARQQQQAYSQAALGQAEALGTQAGQQLQQGLGITQGMLGQAQQQAQQAQQRQQQRYADIGALQTAGAAQQAQQQAYLNQQLAQGNATLNLPMEQLGALGSIVRGVDLPQSSLQGGSQVGSPNIGGALTSVAQALSAGA